ncbi:MAG TPA: hypothetical protein VJ818_02555 [Actinomycetota bacterium]|nr:hypothetical protein [Actinomycetota bacterium]
MRWSDWIVSLFCLGSGVGVILFWTQRLMQKKVETHRYVMRLHLVAESITAAALIGGGVSTFVAARAPGTVVTVGLGLGLLVYAAVQSPAFYPEERFVRGQLWVIFVLTTAVFVLRAATL